jgi:hypothetical protein
MYAIEFETRIQNGTIEIPAEKKQELLTQIDGDSVRVIILTNKQTQKVKKEIKDSVSFDQVSYIDYLLENPIREPDVQYLSREEIYER